MLQNPPAAIWRHAERQAHHESAPRLQPLAPTVQIDVLRMGWCKIGGEKGAAAVAELLLFNDSLTTVDIRGNQLGNSGAMHISRALKEHANEKLGEIDVGYNEIKDDGAFAIAQVW